MTPRAGFRGCFAALFAFFSMAVLCPKASFAGDLVFGPVTCQCSTGAPTVYNYSFTAVEPAQGLIFKVFNGGLEDTTYELVSSTITLNGVQIIGPSNFNQHVAYLEVPVKLQAQNSPSGETTISSLVPKPDSGRQVRALEVVPDEVFN